MRKDCTPYTGMLRKNFESALEHLLYTEYRFLGGKRVMSMIVNDVKRLIRKFYPDNLSVGQIVWAAIKEDSEEHQFKRVEKHEIIPVVLNLITREEIIKLEKGEKKREVWKEKAARLVNEAHAQGGVLTSADVGMFLSVDSSTACRYLREYQKENDTVLPTRGNIHDIGRGVSHKRTIIEKKLENKSTNQTAKETRHSPESVDRYFKDYCRVKMLLGKNLDKDEITKAIDLSENLVEEYVELIKEKDGKIYESKKK